MCGILGGNKSNWNYQAAVEYYSNKDEDNIEEGIAGDLIIDKVNPNNDNIETTIIGETFIKPRR